MMQVSQSPLLQALGFAIINSLWQYALLWLVYLLTDNLFKLSSHQKYATALTLHLAGFLWFTGTLIFYYNQCLQVAENLRELNALYSLSPGLTGTSVKDKILGLVFKGEQLLPYLSLAYIILLAFLSIKTIRCYRNTQQVRSEGLEKIGVEWRLFVQKIANQLGIKWSVKIYVSRVVHSPVTIGFLKPLILLPIAALNNLSTEQIEAVLLHELAHIKRNDYFVNLFLTIIETTLFFNPFMQLISKQIKRERENSCDDWVLQYNYNVTSYATALLTIARNKSSFKSPLAMSATDNSQTLLLRVKRMIEKKERSINYRNQLVALVFMTVLITSLAFITPSTTVTSSLIKGKEKLVVVEPLAVKVQNPLFNPIFFLANDEKEKTKNKVAPASKVGEVITINHLPASKKVERMAALKQGLREDKLVPPPPPPPKPEILQLRIKDLDSTLNFTVKNLSKHTHLDFKKLEADIKKAKEEFASNKWKEAKNSKQVQQQIEQAFIQLEKLDFQFIQSAVIQSAVKETVVKAKLVSEKECLENEKKKANQKLCGEMAELDRLNNRLFLRAINKDLEVDFEIPDSPDAPGISERENHRYSYTYTHKPRLIIAPRVSINVIPSELNRRKDIETEKQAIDTPAIAPCEKVRKTVTVKRINIIRI